MTHPHSVTVKFYDTITLSEYLYHDTRAYCKDCYSDKIRLCEYQYFDTITVCEYLYYELSTKFKDWYSNTIRIGIVNVHALSLLDYPNGEAKDIIFASPLVQYRRPGPNTSNKPQLLEILWDCIRILCDYVILLTLIEILAPCEYLYYDASTQCRYWYSDISAHCEEQ